MKTTAQYDEHCNRCGYPFDRGESCRIFHELACHVYCADCFREASKHPLRTQQATNANGGA